MFIRQIGNYGGIFGAKSVIEVNKGWELSLWDAFCENRKERTIVSNIVETELIKLA